MNKQNQINKKMEINFYWICNKKGLEDNRKDNGKTGRARLKEKV